MDVLRTLLWGLLLPIVSSCMNTVDTIDPQLWANLVPTGELRLAVPVGPAVSPTFVIQDENTGELKGPVITLGLELAKQLNVPIRYVLYTSTGDIAEAGSNNEWDVTFIPADENRVRILDFGSAYCSFDSTFLIRAGLEVKSIAELDRPEYVVAVVANTTASRAAEAALSQASFRGFNGVVEMRDELKAGTVDAIALSRLTLTNMLADLPGATILEEAFRSTATSVAVPKGRSSALAYVSTFVEESKGNGLIRQALDDAGLAAAEIAHLSPIDN